MSRHEEQALVAAPRAPTGAPEQDGSGVNEHDQARLDVVDQTLAPTMVEDAPKWRRRRALPTATPVCCSTTWSRSPMPVENVPRVWLDELRGRETFGQSLTADNDIVTIPEGY